MPTYTETTYLVARSKTTGLPLTSASVQLKRGATTLTMSHKGQGLYEATGVPRGYWAVWIDGVDTGASHAVGTGKLEDIGHETGLYPRSTSGGWEFVNISGVLSNYLPLTGGTLTGALVGTKATFTGSDGVLTNYLHINNSDPSITLQEHHIYTRGNASGAYYGWNTKGNGAGAVSELILRYAGGELMRFVGGDIRLPSVGAGTVVAGGWLGFDADGDLVKSAQAGGMSLSGHNDLSTPWSVGDASTWNASSAGVQVDPVGTYGLWFKGNALVEQAVSQAFTLYRATSATNSEVCLNFDLQDSLGNQESYAQICGEIISSTNGSEQGRLELKYRSGGSQVVGATLGVGGLTASQVLNSVTISSIASGLRLNAVTSGTINNFISHNGINAIIPFFGGTATLGIDSSAGVTIAVDTTFLVVTSPVKMAFPRFFRTAISGSIGASIVEIEVTEALTSSPYTYSFRNRTAFTLGAGGAFNSGIPLIVPIIP